MSETVHRPELPAELVERIEEHREDLKTVIKDDGEFSKHAERLLQLAECNGGG